MPRLPLIALAALVVATAATQPPALSKRAKRGLAFAQNHCAACHGITANATSPNPEAPPWDDIANQPGLTAITLRTFLRDSHNYPEAMNFTVDRARVRELADYMVTLQRPGYKPSI